ncbi:CHAT domain-containing protein [Limnoraphis robusta]|uniref:CHAT domain-containing protein n=1 Tax=Limnoraphis robusta CCNP1315 TaxID=3110306 RepID=A0ABU5U422_9CYAN|nr:CHAT domain-containing protein [Limnoraphis robusta]MEA5520843.1 CHAT domain-containing protein [Limnoraphis robusta CCNP1315]
MIKLIRHQIQVFLALTLSVIRIRLFRYNSRLVVLSLMISGVLLAVLSQATFSQENPQNVNWSEQVTSLEETWEKQYEDYFNRNLAEVTLKADDIAKILSRIASQTGSKPAILWVAPQADYLKLILLTPDGEATGDLISEADHITLIKQVQRLYLEVTNPRRIGTTSYLKPAQQLYQWIVKPFEATLAEKGIDILLFCTGPGLRTLPLGVLHDGKQFLVEKYSPTRIPAFNLLIDTNYGNIKAAQVLAMGVSEFADQNPLPAVPVELSTIIKPGAGERSPLSNLLGQWPGKSFLNQVSTLQNLETQLASNSFGIIHLATHAQFKSGEPQNSYIQLWDTQLRLNQMQEMRWNKPPAELLVLSACQTAVGDQDVELGFAGLAIQSGVKSALASLWYISDRGTLALMSEFYQQLKTASTKAEALQKAQVAMIQGKVRLQQGELLISRGEVALPPSLVSNTEEELSHPYYWSGFTLIGNPW